MKKLPQQIATDADSHSLERAFSVREENLKNTKEIVKYLNNLCTVLVNVKELPNRDGFYNDVCKRVAKYVLSEMSSVRAITYRILRKASQLPDELSVLLNMHMDSFVIRSLEIDTNNSDERIEALKLCSMMLSHMNIKAKVSDNDGLKKKDYSSAVFPENIYRTLISIASCFFTIQLDRTKVEEKKDELGFSCFAVIIEQAAVTPDLILNSIDTGWIVELLTYAAFSDRLSTCVCRILCSWLDSPHLRMQAKLRLVLNRIFASIVEIELFELKEPIELKWHWLSNDSFHLENFSQIFLNLLRTWAGLFACSAAGNQKTSFASALSFLDYIGLSRPTNANSRKIHDLIVECCCEILELPYSKMRFIDWFHMAHYYSTMYRPDAYKCSIRNEFILSEHEMFLKIDQQHINVNDLLESFRSVVIYLLINANLIQALSRIILQDPDHPVALRATLLFHDLLLASSTCLPMEWRLRVLSLPTLVHGACQIFSESHILKKGFLDDNDYKMDKVFLTYADQRNVIVLLNRLDVLNSIASAQKAQQLPITNLQLFVQSSPTAIRLHKSKLSNMNYCNEDGDTEYNEKMLERLLFKAMESDGRLCWPIVDKLFQLLQIYYSNKDVPIKYSREFYNIFKMVFKFISPAESSLTSFDGDRFVIICCCRGIHVSLLFAAREAQYKKLLADFINDFIASISSDALLNGPLSPKNLFLDTGTIYYFAFIGAISSIEEGRQMLEATPLLQLFVNLVKDTKHVEYVKLIVSCLDYSSEDSFNRFILQTALTSASVDGRKWTTQFLNILLSHNISNFSIWGIKLLLRQLADSSAKLVRHALRLLHRWIPHYPESVYLIKDICFDEFGDAGILLKTYLFSSESYVKDNSHDTLTTLDYWKKKFNTRYVEIIDEDVRVALLGSKRSIDGQYARPSNERIAKFGVPMPVHLYGQLALHDTGRELLLKSNEVDRLLDILRDSPLPTDTCQTSELKGALYALGHIVANLNPNLLPSETVPIICRFAECCPVLSIRGSAFWVLNLIGNTKLGSTLLLSLGWESSNFIVGRGKSNIPLLKEANMDINKIWIQCIDGKLPSQYGINLKNEDKNETISLDDTNNLVDDTISGSKHTYAIHSNVMNGWNSITMDEFDCGVLWYGKMNYSSKNYDVSRRESRLFNHGNVIAVQMTREEIQDCLMIRSQFRLSPFLLNRMLMFDSALEIPMNYIAISDDKFLYCRDLRNLMGSERTKSLRKSHSESTESQPIKLPGQSISLPRSPDLFFKNIFVGDEFIEHNCDSLFIKWKHRINNCFYCSWPEEYFGNKNTLEVEVSSEARDEIISMFLLQGSKCAVNSKKLLKNYSSNRKIFTSPCLYSDILVLLAQHDYSTEARRLVHELFTDALKKLSLRDAYIFPA